MMTWEDLSAIKDRKDLLAVLHDAVFSMRPAKRSRLAKFQEKRLAAREALHKEAA